MPSGEALKVWFPEMIDAIKFQWHQGMSWDEIIQLCRSMETKWKEIRKERNIKPAKMRCPKCGEKDMVQVELISVRLLFYALKNNDIISAKTFEDFDKRWKKYMKQNNLDGYGRLKKPNIREKEIKHETEFVNLKSIVKDEESKIQLGYAKTSIPEGVRAEYIRNEDYSIIAGIVKVESNSEFYKIEAGVKVTVFYKGDMIPSTQAMRNEINKRLEFLAQKACIGHIKGKFAKIEK